VLQHLSPRRPISTDLNVAPACRHSAPGRAGRRAQAPVQARVIACHDGDTCTLDHDILPGRDRVRVRGADAPEIKAHCAAEKRLAVAAKQFTTSRLLGRTAILEDVREDKCPKRVDVYVTMPDGRDLLLASPSKPRARIES
jgi:micrococcal nuclease